MTASAMVRADITTAASPWVRLRRLASSGWARRLSCLPDGETSGTRHQHEKRVLRDTLRLGRRIVGAAEALGGDPLNIGRTTRAGCALAW